MAANVASAPIAVLQFLNNAGQPNVGGSLLTQVGGVNYPTYQDAAGDTPLPNPIPLNSRGEISNSSGISSQLFLALGVTYTFTLYDANGNLIWVQENIYTNFQWPTGSTANRPPLLGIGQTFFDTSLGQPIWANLVNSSLVWVNAAGVQV